MRTVRIAPITRTIGSGSTPSNMQAILEIGGRWRLTREARTVGQSSKVRIILHPDTYVSMTSLFDASIADERNPRRFVDAVSIPYVVLPPEGFKHAKLGDFATVVNLQNGKVAAAIVADESAPELPMGEGSIALAKALGIDSDPRSGGVEQGIGYVIYPGSGNGQPRALDEIVTVSQVYFQRWGGVQRLRGCLNE